MPRAKVETKGHCHQKEKRHDANPTPLLRALWLADAEGHVVPACTHQLLQRLAVLVSPPRHPGNVCPFQPRCHLKEHALGSFRGPWLRVNHPVSFASTCDDGNLAPNPVRQKKRIPAVPSSLFLLSCFMCACASVCLYATAAAGAHLSLTNQRPALPSQNRRQRMTASSPPTSLWASYFLTCIAFPEWQLCQGSHAGDWLLSSPSPPFPLISLSKRALVLGRAACR